MKKQTYIVEPVYKKIKYFTYLWEIISLFIKSQFLSIIVFIVILSLWKLDNVIVYIILTSNIHNE